MNFLSGFIKVSHMSLFFGFLWAVNISAQENNYVVAGTAYNLENNQVIYRELYTIIDENREVRVDYMTPEGDIFATKSLIYKGELFQPEFELSDHRDDEIVGVRFNGPKMVLIHAKKDTRNEKTLYDNAKVVVDAGFDSYVQLNWDQLVAGKRLRFDFAFPTRLSTIALEIRRVEAAESLVYDKEYGRQWIYLRISPAQKLFSFFAAPIYLAYDPNGKYLMRFHGRSNIDDQYGDPWDVRIEYEYTN
jgi:hypothetical protein